jgi:hypothetical protein
MRIQQLHHLLALLLVTLFKFSPDTTAASPIARTLERNRTASQIPATPLFYFAEGKQAENIKIRLSGQILVTLDTAPELHQINPFRNQTGGIAYRFEGYTSLFGIVEEETDIFYVIASNFSGPPDYYGYEGSVSIFEVDLRNIPDPTVSQSGVKVSKVVDVPQAQLLDGLVIVNQPDGLLMSADAQTGTLYLIDIQKRTANAVLQDELLDGTTDEVAAALAHIGTNGLKYYNGDLYFTNTAKGLYGRVPVNSTTGKPTGRPSILADYGTYVDDLSFDSFGNQFISEDLKGVLLRPANTTAANNQTRLLTILPGADSNAFGRTTLDKCTLYSTFAGAPSGVASIDVGKQGFCG